MSKRKVSNENEEVPEDEMDMVAKRARGSQSNALITASKGHHNSLILRDSNVNERLSSLSAPEISLSGHGGAIYTVSFDTTGKFLASGSMDREIFLWDVFADCKNYNVLQGHKNAVLQLVWPTDTSIISCSADKTVAIWDANHGVRTRKLTEHTAIVNSCAFARDSTNLFATGSDDCSAILWDSRSKSSVSTIYHEYQVLSVAMSHDGNSLFTAGIDNIIRRFDTRVGDAEVPDLMLEGHLDTITGLSVSPDGTRLLSNSMDQSLRIWNIRPFVGAGDSNRCEHVLSGVHHGAEKLLLRCSWSQDSEYVTAGSADRMVHLWETTNGAELCAWPGHKASVNEVIFHPAEPILVSCGSDKQILLGEFSL